MTNLSKAIEETGLGPRLPGLLFHPDSLEDLRRWFRGFPTGWPHRGINEPPPLCETFAFQGIVFVKDPAVPEGCVVVRGPEGERVFRFPAEGEALASPERGLAPRV
ncbi:MAG TPA: hypothetical protein VEI97_08995 [bacterium]|nr:hypothetical protein [bacterium]